MKFPLIYSISNPLGQQSCGEWKQSNWDFYRESGTGQESQMHFKSSKPFQDLNGEASAPTARAARKQFYKIIQSSNRILEGKNVLLCHRDLYPFFFFLTPQLWRIKSIFACAPPLTLPKKRRGGKTFRHHCCPRQTLQEG